MTGPNGPVGAKRAGGARAGAESGAVALEMALILPLLILLVMGVIELGRLAWTRAALDFAVQDAARCAVVRPDLCGSAAATAAYAVRRMAPLTAPPGAFSVGAADCGVQVAAALPYRFLAYRLFPAAPTLTAVACHVWTAPFRQVGR